MGRLTRFLYSPKGAFGRGMPRKTLKELSGAASRKSPSSFVVAFLKGITVALAALATDAAYAPPDGGGGDPAPDAVPDPEPTLKRKRGETYATVTWLDKRHKWRVTFRKDGNRSCVRSFETVEQAQQTKAKYDFDGTISPIIKERPRPYYEPCLKRKRGGGAVLSATPGVSWNKQAKKWTAYFTDGNGKRFHLGKYFDKEEAIKVAAPYYQRQRSTSKWLGLAWDSSAGDGGRWTVVCKHKYIGRFKFEDEEAAARAYNVEAKRIGLTNFNDVPDAAEISKRDRYFKKGEKNQLHE